MADELEFNPFYKELQTRFFATYEEVQQNCLHLCIPTSSSLAGCAMNKQFLDMHVLRPSPLLRDHYTTNMNGKELSWKISEGAFHLLDKTFPEVKVQILSEEIAYNRVLRQYKIFLTQRPMDPLYKPSQDAASPQTSKLPRTLEEHRTYLQSLPRCEKVFQDLEETTSTFLERYVMVDKEEALVAIAKKLESIARKSNMCVRRESGGDRRTQEALWLSVQTYLMGRVYPTVFSTVCGTHREQDRLYEERCRSLRTKLVPKALGVPDDYHCSYPTTIALLNTIDALSSPLEKMYCIQDAMDTVTHDVKEHFARILRYGDPEPLASDHLIALLATILVQCTHAHIPSTVYYLQTFFWPVSEADRLGYVLVTFIAAVEYVRGPGVQSFLSQASVTPPTASSKATSTTGNIAPPPPANGSSSGRSLSSDTSSQQAKKPTPIVVSQSASKNSVTSDLGPFLSQLLEDDTVTSQEFYRRHC